MSLFARWTETLNGLHAQGRFRALKPPRGIDFTSNDYLGYATRGQRTDGRGQTADGRGQRSEDRGQTAETEGRKTAHPVCLLLSVL